MTLTSYTFQYTMKPEEHFLNFMGYLEDGLDDTDMDNVYTHNAFYDGDLVASAKWNTAGVVYHVYTQPAHRGRGVMTRLIRDMTDDIHPGTQVSGDFVDDTLRDHIQSIIDELKAASS